MERCESRRTTWLADTVADTGGTNRRHGQVALLDRPRRYLHRRGGALARGRDHGPQAALAEPRRLRRRRFGGHPLEPWAALRCADPGRAHRRRENGHYGRHQRAPGAHGRAHAARHYQGPQGPAGDRLPGPARHLCQEDRQARDALCPRRRGQRARARRWPGGAAARYAGVGARPQGCAGRRHRLGRHRAHAFLRPSAARAAGGRAGAGSRLHPGLRQPRGLAADQDRRPRRHHGGGCVSVADPATVRGEGGGGVGVRPCGSDPILRTSVVPRGQTRRV